LVLYPIEFFKLNIFCFIINQCLFECIDMNLIKNFGLQKIFFNLSFKSCTTNLLKIGSNRFYSSFLKLNQNDSRPIKPIDTLLTQVRTYKAKTRLRKRCRHCYFIWRNGRL